MNQFLSHCLSCNNQCRICVSCHFPTQALPGLTRVILRAILMPSLESSLVALRPPPLLKRASCVDAKSWEEHYLCRSQIEAGLFPHMHHLLMQICSSIHKEVSTSGFFLLEQVKLSKNLKQGSLPFLNVCIHYLIVTHLSDFMRHLDHYCLGDRLDILQLLYPRQHILSVNPLVLRIVTVASLFSFGMNSDRCISSPVLSQSSSNGGPSCDLLHSIVTPIVTASSAGTVMSLDTLTCFIPTTVPLSMTVPS